MPNLIDAYKVDMSRTQAQRLSHKAMISLREQGAYKSILEGLQPFIFTQAMRYSGKTTETSLEPADLISIANIAAMAAIKSWNPNLKKSVKLTTWVARRIKTDVLRSLYREKSMMVSIDEALDNDNPDYNAQWLLAQLQGDSRNPEKAAMNTESLQTLLALADQLPPRQKQALLASWEEETRAEIAESMGISSQAVGKLLAKANKTLKGVSDSATA